jgi:hypothetical protein
MKITLTSATDTTPRPPPDRPQHIRVELCLSPNFLFLCFYDEYMEHAFLSEHAQQSVSLQHCMACIGNDMA